MKAYRYNSKKREDRKFNNTGIEKNPNNISFYASNLKYADNYKFIYDNEGDVVYECDLVTCEIEKNGLFDMNSNFESLNTYKSYINNEITIQLNEYTRFMNEAKELKVRKMWSNQIENLKNRESELKKMLIYNEFQMLSDFEIQNELVIELKSLGFNGYFTNNEIAIF